MTEFTLSESDKLQPLWIRLKAHLIDRLDDTRQRNDHPQSEQDTAARRGEIRCLKRIIALGDARPLPGDEGPP